MEWHNLSSYETIKLLKSNLNEGLTRTQVEQRLHKYGKNKLQEKKKKSFIRKFIEQFADFMVIMLFIAAIISFITAIIDQNGDYIDSIIILSIVIVNSLIGVIQENKAESAIEALKKLSAPKARVIRDGEQSQIDSEFLVPGDIMLLDTGDFISADARIIESINLKVEESALTGESLPTEKDGSQQFRPDTPVGDRKNMVFAGSSITSGHAVCIVTQTGMQSQVGKIAHFINEETSPDTPLQKKLAQTGKILGLGALIICVVIFLLGLTQDESPLEIFMIAISLAVAAIPEGLPAVVTIVLAIGVRRMAANRAIIRKLSAVETLGSANIICSDKTGTLTQNKMTVVEISSFDKKITAKSKQGLEVLTMGALCNNATLIQSKKDYKAVGDPTEAAILTAAVDAGRPKGAIDNAYPRIAEIPFSSDRKLMSTVHKLKSGKFRVVTKGAPDVLLKRCSCYLNEDKILSINTHIKRLIDTQNTNMAEGALRVIAVAFKDIDKIENYNQDYIENDLIFAGLIGMIDPPRKEAKTAVRDCLKASITPVMITGDHILTAKAIASELGIFKAKDKAMTGAQLDKLSQKELEKEIYKYTVFARVSPEHKVRIVKAFQKRGAIVAMTGDGVNDAPSLKAADIGCAMGLSGTDVAKSAADMILTDDNFSTIVAAVKQGRGIFQNIKKTVHFLLSSNIGEIITVLFAFLIKLPTPLLAIQLLWVNLVTDSFPALALGVEPVEKDVMKSPPSRSSLFSGGLMIDIAIEGSFIGAISMLAFTIGRVYFDIDPYNPIIGRTMAFAVLSLSQIIHAFNVRSDRSIFEIGLFSNMKMIYSFVLCVILQVSVISVPFLSEIFKTYNLNQIQWIIVSVLSVSPIIIVEIEKLIHKKSK